DILAWTGNYAPCEYAIEKVITMSTVDHNQSGPSIYCVHSAESNLLEVALSDILVFTLKWGVARNTFHPPYYRRNVVTEIIGVIYRTLQSSAIQLSSGIITCTPSYMPQGKTYDRRKQATSDGLPPARTREKIMGF
ncbi:Homogentisate 1,2-dioxygenase, partial [Fusarium redolens]